MGGTFAATVASNVFPAKGWAFGMGCPNHQNPAATTMPNPQTLRPKPKRESFQ